MAVRYNTDLKGSQYVLYNKKTGYVGRNIHQVIDYENLEFHFKGLRKYLDFRYSVWGQTSVRNMNFLGPSSSALPDWDWKLHIEEL